MVDMVSARPGNIKWQRVKTTIRMHWPTSWPTRLANLHRSLEDRGNKGTDWSLARALEDRIGAYQPSAGDFDRAEQLLQAHGF
jgi:hypothetical protein